MIKFLFNLFKFVDCYCNCHIEHPEKYIPKGGYIVASCQHCYVKPTNFKGKWGTAIA